MAITYIPTKDDFGDIFFPMLEQAFQAKLAKDAQKSKSELESKAKADDIQREQELLSQSFPDIAGNRMTLPPSIQNLPVGGQFEEGARKAMASGIEPKKAFQIDYGAAQKMPGLSLSIPGTSAKFTIPSPRETSEDKLKYYQSQQDYSKSLKEKRPEGYNETLTVAIDDINAGKDPHNVYKNMASIFPAYAKELRDILVPSAKLSDIDFMNQIFGDK